MLPVGVIQAAASLPAVFRAARSGDNKDSSPSCAISPARNRVSACGAAAPPATYHIRVRGDPNKLSQWFDGLAISQQVNGEALLTGTVVNREALHHVLRRIRDLGMSVRYLRVAEMYSSQGGSSNG
jgi:hypothetical protein